MATETRPKGVDFSKLDITPDTSAEEMGTSLVPVEEQSLVPAQTQEWGKQPEFGAEDVFLPMLKLAQATTREVQAGDAKQGEWVVQGYPSIKNPTIVPLAAKKIFRRIATKMQGKPVACWNHAVAADEDCPNCRWQYEKSLASGNFEAQLVTTYHYEVYVKELASPAVMELSGTAGSAAKVLNAKIMGRGIGNLAVRLGATLSENDKGRWYSPVIQELPERDDALLAEARALVTA